MPLAQPQTGFEDIQLFAYLNSQVLDRNYEDFWAGGSGATASPWTDNWVLSGLTGNVTLPVTDLTTPGTLRIDTSTSATGGSAVNSSMAQILLPTAEMQYQVRFKIPVLSDGIETFLIRMGVGASFASSGDITNGLYLQYDHTLAGGALRLITANAGVRTTVNGITPLVADTWYEIDMLYTATPSPIAVCTLDGVEEFRTDNGFPLSTTSMTFCPCNIIKSAGLTERSIEVDYCYLGVSFAVAR